MANRFSNDYNDQDYPRYNDRDDRYDSQSEGSRDSGRLRNEQRNQSGSGRENTQGGAYDYNQSEGQQNQINSRRSSNERQNNSRDYDDFASSGRRSSGNYNDQSKRASRDDRGDYTLYGYDHDQRHADRSGDSGGYGERTKDYQNQNYNFSGGSYARSNDRQQQNREHGGSSRYYGDQDEQSHSKQNSDRQNRGGVNKSGQSFYGQGGGYTGSSESGYDYQPSKNSLRDRNQNDQERGWWERTTDEVASWFGDGEAGQRRAEDSRDSNYDQSQNRGQQQNSHRGRGPRNYKRSDERIKEEINDRLTDYPHLDASDIEVEVASGGEVTLSGTVESRYAKRMAEDIAENVSGVTHLENRLRVKQVNNQAGYSSTASTFNDANTAQALPNASNASDTSGTYGSPEDLAANYSNQGLSEASPIGKPATGDLTGSRNFTGDVDNSNDDSNVGAIAAPSLTETSTSDLAASNDFDSSLTFSQRGVDKLSDPTK